MGQGGATKNQRMRSINLGVAVAVDFAGTPFTKGIETEWRRQRFFVGSVRSMKARFFSQKKIYKHCLSKLILIT